MFPPSNAPAAGPSVGPPTGVSLGAPHRFSLPTPSFRYGMRQEEAIARQRELEKLVLSSPRTLWPIAAKHFREELAALREIKGLQQVQQKAAKHKRTQEDAHDEEHRVEGQEDGTTETRYEGGQKIEAVDRRSKAETEVSDADLSAEEVRLLWRGITVPSKKRKPKKSGEEKSSWDLLQNQVQQVQRDFRRRLEWSSWWETGDRRSGATVATSEKDEKESEDASSTADAETEEEDEHLPVFGLRSIHKKERLLAQVRPVWRPRQGPLHYDTGLPRHLIKASAAVAPPTGDELRRLRFYPEEVKRREIEDGVLFETAGEVLRRRYWRLWKQYVQEPQQHEKQTSKRGETDRGRVPLERGNGQVRAVDAYEDCPSQGRRPSSSSKRTTRRGDILLAQQTNRRLHNAKATPVDPFVSSWSPPRWLLPRQRRLRRARPYGKWKRVEFENAVAAREEVRAKESQWDRRYPDGRGSPGVVEETASSPQSVAGNRRKRQLASPGGALDEELVVLKDPREGWRWTIEDRDRWKRSLLLRRAMRNNQVLFAADLEERQYAEDYERFMGRPFTPPRADWGGYAYYAAAEDEEEVKAERKRITEEEELKEGGVEEDDASCRQTRGTAVDEEAAIVREKAWREAFFAHLEEERQQQEKQREEASMAEQIGKLQSKTQLHRKNTYGEKIENLLIRTCASPQKTEKQHINA